MLKDEYDFDAAVEKMEWLWNKIKLEKVDFLREFVDLAKEMSNNCDDSVEYIIGEFILENYKEC